MSKEILLTIEKFYDGEESKFLIRSPKEIQLTLNAIVQKKSFTILYFDNEQRFLKTLLLAATESGIWLDVGPSEEDNIHILHSNSITFVTMHQGAKVQFVCRHPLMATYASLPAFFFPLPDHILRLQRRDYFRLSISPDAPLKCIIPPVQLKSDKPDVITILDISVGGIALICKEHNVKLESGEIYPDCQIELPGIGILLASIQVKNLFDVTSHNGEVSKHAGCEFVQLDGKMCMLLQRYVGIMQSKLSKMQ